VVLSRVPEGELTGVNDAVTVFFSGRTSRNVEQ
jgi:hypothetical protein